MKGPVLPPSPRHVALLRQEIAARNSFYAALNHLPHVTSYGELPVVVYQESECGRRHGNFIPASYRAILKRPEWRRRLLKVHSNGSHSLPKSDRVWRELDSSMSSDALLMNIFCYPGLTRRVEVSRMLGTEPRDFPEFGFRPHIPLRNAATERTEIDMKLGNVLFEAKLTEGDFQIQKAEIVEQYRDLEQVFDCRALPRISNEYVSYQLIRQVLAAYALNVNVCILLDARRPDLLEDWYRIMSCVRSITLKTQCKVLTWQELARCLPGALQRFLDVKYGIVSLDLRG
jgi:hypothetical protein